MLNCVNIANPEANRTFLLEKTQHMIGGFGKCVDEPPGKKDIYYFILAVVVDPAMLML